MMITERGVRALRALLAPVILVGGLAFLATSASAHAWRRMHAPSLLVGVLIGVLLCSCVAWILTQPLPPAKGA